MKTTKPGPELLGVMSIERQIYRIGRKVCHKAGLPWTDPRTGITHQPPKKKRPTKKP